MRSHRVLLCLFSLGLLLACDTSKVIAPGTASQGLLAFAASSHLVAADGASLTQLIAVVPSGGGTIGRSVIFSTTAGTLVGASAPTVTVTESASSSDSATVLLQAPRDSLFALVRASAGSTVLQDTIRFTRALPMWIDLDPQQFAVKPDPTIVINITAYLRRTPGLVSPGTRVRFGLSGPAGADLGTLGAPSMTDAQGAAVVRYAPGNTTYRGPVLITADADGANGTSVRGQTTVQIIPP